VSAAAGTAGGWPGSLRSGKTVPDDHRHVDSEAELRCQELLDWLADVGGCWAVSSSRGVDRLGLRSGAAVAWYLVRLLLGMPLQPSGAAQSAVRRSVSGQRRSGGRINGASRPLCQV